MMPMGMEMGDESYGEEQYYDEEIDMDPMVASGDTEGDGALY